ncbi:MAG TPA: DUF4339 domain-containing protein [Candidatus Cloacimonadota bacterium]|nr:DUF4339 domain-containing protein [Candidatus Cloacimonadota bacterium]
MASWYYSKFGQTKGPISQKALINKILKEELELDDYVSEESNQAWKKVRDFPQLMDELHKPIDLHIAAPPADFLSAETASVSQNNVYFYIPLHRLLVMTILTGGLYELYWFYKQWHYWAEQKQQAWRSPDREMSNIFIVLQIFERIETDKELNRVVRADFNGTALFWTWLLFGLAAWILTALFLNDKVTQAIVTFTLLIADVYFLLPVQKYINSVNEKLGNQYEKPSWGHYLCLAIVWIPLLIVAFNQLIKSVLMPFKTIR